MPYACLPIRRDSQDHYWICNPPLHRVFKAEVIDLQIALNLGPGLLHSFGVRLGPGRLSPPARAFIKQKQVDWLLTMQQRGRQRCPPRVLPVGLQEILLPWTGHRIFKKGNEPWH